MAESTKQRLAGALRAAGAPMWMVKKAETGAYDDYESDSPTPIVDLVCDCRETGRSALARLAEEAIQGIYDGTREEADAWFEREGKGMMGRE